MQGVQVGPRDQRRIRDVDQVGQGRRAERRDEVRDRLAVPPLVGPLAVLHAAQEGPPVAVHEAREENLLHVGAGVLGMAMPRCHPVAPSAVGYRPYSARAIDSPCMPPRSRASTTHARAATALNTAAEPACAHWSSARPSRPPGPRPQQERGVGQPEGVIHLIQGLALREPIQEEGPDPIARREPAAGRVPGEPLVDRGHQTDPARHGGEDGAGADHSGRLQRSVHGGGLRHRARDPFARVF